MSEFVFSDGEDFLDKEIESLCDNGSISAARLLQFLEMSDDAAVEETLDCIRQNNITLDISDLPPVSLSGSSALRLKQEAQFTSVDKITAGLEENDPLRLYLQELAATPAAGDVQQFADRYLSGEHYLAEPMVNLCLSRVLELSMEYTGHGVLLLDLIQEGSMGLWESIQAFQGGDFTAHADWYIRQAMARSVVLSAHYSGVGQMLRSAMEDYRDADQRLLAELGRNPTVEEIAEALHITPEECAALEKMVANARNMERTKQSQQEPEPTPEDDQAVEDTAYFQVRQRIMELLSTLPELDAKLLTLRFGLEGGKPLSPVQTGEVLGLTPAQVVSREAAALALLRNKDKEGLQ